MDETRALLGPQGFAVFSIPNVAQDLRVAALEAEVTETQALLRMREDALLALIEQRATLELRAVSAGAGSRPRDFARPAGGNCSHIRENAERIAQSSAETPPPSNARMSEENAERIAKLELDAARGLKRQDCMAPEVSFSSPSPKPPLKRLLNLLLRLTVRSRKITMTSLRTSKRTSPRNSRNLGVRPFRSTN